MKKHTWTIVGVIAVVLLGASFVYSNQIAQQANEGVEFSAHIKGNPDAPTKLVEYSDFQCPACAQAFPVVQQLLEEHGDKISFEYKHFPLFSIHPHAVPAARAAEAAGQQGQFFAMHDKLFEEQSVWSNAASPNVYFEQYAEELELDMKLFKRHLNASVIDDKINDEFNEARELGFTGTPSFMLNGQRLQFSSYDEFIELVLLATSQAGTSSAPAVDVEFGI